ncbi:hypothetical protein AX774_g876 [Zancudomyces culisetae]|uniref:Carbohydrate-binding module family 19 domain-containing protein n=1 Tax=Zancudomyces culisetae TaxID=1213189 RepID=A0A1R1PQG4_ZANCU|nr:hypothetical protein AX774_g3285 [Zancudomyces culisetae]OMH85588.1 hypothetical protein AX774_g876 [Zancudomyces culisetae]|eukprot:OMH83210.1 hypothetical protein AX774_g3285 [Zancudomyces culisetae]
MKYYKGISSLVVLMVASIGADGTSANDINNNVIDTKDCVDYKKITSNHYRSWRDESNAGSFTQKQIHEGNFKYNLKVKRGEEPSSKNTVAASPIDNSAPNTIIGSRNADVDTNSNTNMNTNINPDNKNMSSTKVADSDAHGLSDTAPKVGSTAQEVSQSADIISAGDSNLVTQSGEQKAEQIEDPNKYKKPCTEDGKSVCSTESERRFYKCTGSYWTQMDCEMDTVCYTQSEREAVCLSYQEIANRKKSEKLAQKKPCTTLGQTRCDYVSKYNYLQCDKDGWTVSKCGGTNVCKLDKATGRAQCIEKEVAEKEVEKCKVNGESKCNDQNKNIFLKCIENEWVGMTCDGDNECIMSNANPNALKKRNEFSNSDGVVFEEIAVCYNPKLGAPEALEPCDDEGKLKCANDSSILGGNAKGNSTDGKDIYYQCLNNNWTKMKCGSGTECSLLNDRTSVGCITPREVKIISNNLLGSTASTHSRNILSSQIVLVFVFLFLLRFTR